MRNIPVLGNLSNLHNWWDNIVVNNNENLKDELKQYFESIDQEIFLSSWRKNKGYIVKDINSRKILTIYGVVTFKRRRYKYFDFKFKKWNYVYLADKKIGIEKYERVASYVKLKILELIANGIRYDDILNILGVNLSKMSISNIINSFDFKDFADLTNYEIKKVSLTKCLYIQFDDTFLFLRNKRKKEKYRIRIVTYHTGYLSDKSTKARKVIADKRCFFKLIKIGTKINTSQFVDHVYQFAKKFYDNVDDVKVLINGDGATWIREVSKYWLGSIYIFDKFHAFKKLNQALLVNRSEKTKTFLELTKSYFESGCYNELQCLLNLFLKNSSYQHKIKAIKEVISYFKANKDGIINQNDKDNIGCHIESDISHNIKWLLGYGSKAFSYQIFQNMLILKISKLNQINPLVLITEKVLKQKQINQDYYWSNLWANKTIEKFILNKKV